MTTAAPLDTEVPVSVVTEQVIDYLNERLVVVNESGCRKPPSERIKVGCALLTVKPALWEYAHGPVPRGHVLRRTCATISCCEPSHHVLVSRAAWGHALATRAPWLTGAA